MLIDNFEEKIETEMFPDNSVLVLENAYFEPAEIGFRYDEGEENDDGAGGLVKYRLEDKEEYLAAITSYASALVVEDKVNLT